jgi:hypothetical protein
MRSRRFVLLAGVLVTLNLVLWFAAPGLALRQAVIQQLFGPRLVRADVVDRSAGTTIDTRIDRGFIVAANASQVVLREADGRVQPIPISVSTRITGFGRALPAAALKHGQRVLVTWPANGAATSVNVESRGRLHP